VLSGLVRKIHREATAVSFGSPDDLRRSNQPHQCLIFQENGAGHGCSRGIGRAIARRLGEQGGDCRCGRPRRITRRKRCGADGRGHVRGGESDVTDQRRRRSDPRRDISRHGARHCRQHAGIGVTNS